MPWTCMTLRLPVPLIVTLMTVATANGVWGWHLEHRLQTNLPSLDTLVYVAICGLETYLPLLPSVSIALDQTSYSF